MTREEIEKIIEKNKQSETYFKISFKKRNTIHGFFVDCSDADNLKSKNFWRIVSFSHLSEWNKTQNINLSRLYQGSDFSKITLAP